MPILAYILTALAAYLLGSIPTGYLVGKAKGVDIRAVGSKNMGATNVFRTLGKGPGILVLLVDALKGFGSVLLSGGIARLLNNTFRYEPDPILLSHLAVVAGIGAVLGHNYTCWLAFKGGKGIATTAGAYFALAPLSATIALGVWILFFVSTRYVSIASLAAAVALPTAVWLTQKSLLLSLVTTLLGVMAIYKHKANIQRLLAGTESRMNFKKEKPAA